MFSQSVAGCGGEVCFSGGGEVCVNGGIFKDNNGDERAGALNDKHNWDSGLSSCDGDGIIEINWCKVFW